MVGTGSLTTRADVAEQARGGGPEWVGVRNDPGMAQVMGARPPAREGIGMVHCWNSQTHDRRVMEPGRATEFFGRASWFMTGFSLG